MFSVYLFIWTLNEKVHHFNSLEGLPIKYDTKIVYCNNVLEIYQYRMPIKKGYENKIEKEQREQTEDVKKENFYRSIKRTKTKIRQLINTNYVEGKSSFLTLTFKENMTDYDLAFKYWDLFKKKVEYRLKIKLQYVGVVEFQNANKEVSGRNSIHFHIALFNVDFIKHELLYELWNKSVPGGVHIKGIKDADNVGAYLTYYMGKDMDDFFDNEYKGKKRYFKSRGLKDPVEVFYNKQEYIQDKEQIESLLNSVKDNIVFNYVSDEFEIKKKDYVVNDEEVQIVQGSLLPDVKDIVLDIDEIETKKELPAYVVGVQQLQYIQVVLNQNLKFRKKINNVNK